MNLPSQFFLDAAAPTLQPRDLETRLRLMKRGGVDGALATVASIENFAASMRAVGAWLEAERQRHLRIRIAHSVTDLREAQACGDFGVVLHFQGADPIEDQLDYINVFHASGLRVMQITYNQRNRLGDGCFEETDAGLSKLGRQVVKRLESLSIAVDLSHAGNRTALEAVGMSSKPMLVSHANVRALCDTPRNVTDDLIRQVAAGGGVVGVCAVPFFLRGTGQATLDSMIDHAAYIADLVGPSHVGVGLDFCEETEEDYAYYGYDERYIPRPPWVFPSGIAGHEEAGNIAGALRARGFSEEEVRGVLGENFLRVLGCIWGN